MLECTRVSLADVSVNGEISDVSYGVFDNTEVLLVTKLKGPVYYFEVVNSDEYAHYDIARAPQLPSSQPSPAMKVFREHNCLDVTKWCSVASMLPITAGFFVVDRHRILKYNYTWIPDSSVTAAEVEDVLVASFGQMNIRGGFGESELFFPTHLAEYTPLNSTHVAAGHQIMPNMPHAHNRLILVSDTGNHRVVILNASASDSGFEYVGHFGVTGEVREDSTGLNWPWGIAMFYPAWEFHFEPIFANVFVADRRNHRLVKLNLGYPELPCADEPERLCRSETLALGFAAEYGNSLDVWDTPDGLDDPAGVVVFRHYILVAQAHGNRITVLTVDHQPPYDLIFVTRLMPSSGMALLGSITASPYGYVWYNFIGDLMVSKFGSSYLPEDLRYSLQPSRLEDFLSNCVNESWYMQVVRHDAALFVEHIGFALNASSINWHWPELPGYVDIWSLNGTAESGFDFDLLDQLVFGGAMEICLPPTAPPLPPINTGDDSGFLGVGQTGSASLDKSAPLVLLMGIVLQTFLRHAVYSEGW